MALSGSERARLYRTRHPEAARENSRRWRAAHPERARATDLSQRPNQAAWHRARRQSHARFLASVKLTVGCVDCGYRAHPAALDFDHVRGEKRFNFARMGSKSWDNLMVEMDKCDVRCANCHRVVSRERVA